jgi:hypothetical protein
VQVNRATNYAAVAIECMLPETIANHDHWWRANLIFIFSESATEFRRQTDNIEKIPSDRSARHPFGFPTRNTAKIS